jgi:fructokinase
MLLVIGEAITAFMRTINGSGPDYETGFAGPFASGAPMIFASAAARLGIKTVAVMGVGADDFGWQMQQVLVSHGVDVSPCVVSEKQPTACAFVTYRSDGRREFIFYLDGTAATQVPLDALGGLPEQADFLHISGSALSFGGSLATTIEAAIARMRQAGKKISVDPNVRAETALPETLARVKAAVLAADYVFPSQGELASLGLEVSHLTAAQKIVVEKDGAKGATVYTANSQQHIPAPAVEVVNADGAGDIFAAAFMGATIRGIAPNRATTIACQVAARSVTSPGPMDSLIQPSDLNL